MGAMSQLVGVCNHNFIKPFEAPLVVPSSMRGRIHLAMPEIIILHINPGFPR